MTILMAIGRRNGYPAPMPAVDSKQRVSRQLIKRLTIVTLLLCIVFAAIVWLTERQRLQHVVTDLARFQIQPFIRQVQQLFDRTGTMPSPELQAALDQFVASPERSTLRDGQFVLVRIYRPDGAVLGEFADESFTSLAQVRARLDAAEVSPLAPDETRVVTVRLGLDPYVGVGRPIVDSTDIVVAMTVAVFAVSPQAVTRVRGNILRTMAYVLAVVLVCAAMIYPVIRQLVLRVSGQADLLLEANLATIQVLGSAIAKRDGDTDSHNFRVSAYAVRLGEAVRLAPAQIRRLVKGAFLHDVGKIAIPDEVLLKPGKLDPDELKIMRTHVEQGLEVIERAEWLSDARDVVGSHHERFDGSGYPEGLNGDAIPLVARIFAIVDVFDALTSKRPYKQPLSHDQALDIMAEASGSHFDPGLFETFCEISQALHRELGDSDGEQAREALQSIVQRYFRDPISAAAT